MADNEEGIKDVFLKKDSRRKSLFNTIKTFFKNMSFNLSVIRSFDKSKNPQPTIKIVYSDDKEFVFYGTYSFRIDEHTSRKHYLKSRPISELSSFKARLGIQ